MRLVRFATQGKGREPEVHYNLARLPRLDETVLLRVKSSHIPFCVRHSYAASDTHAREPFLRRKQADDVGE